ncbi:beta-glucosidase BglX [Cellulophaga lytica]|uniref:Periplasmic beta-glucosidase n=1 Tax=Cellulophaga lytica (strain ATCC 23178 / DSM 7489 / JCM 8516 / NBRC 14961 / NCIMB 1423 / VKM B-1433 / Cy l20) TaxID=867900 RepID=F0RF50_CELLC|nr:beta-glucosidase BglX [Cellulophaga lytica]ADY31066.1 Beta-glucosidase [Cellulophaga lytica DSM 7489]WQG78023.1 beta-glucosidase BglX [Cellulophaga lytica]
MKRVVIYSISIVFAIGILSCTNATSKSASESLGIDKKVDSILAIMTLEEKIGQMNQYNGFWDVTGPTPKDGDAAKKYEHLRKGYVGSMLNVTGVKDVRAVQKIAVEETRLGIPLIIGFDVIHGYKTLSPIPLAEAASWDLNAIKKSAEIAALESSAAGINWTFAPMVDISRDARWGRVMEGAGEDTYLGSKIAVARVQGFQGSNLADKATIVACAKHFAGYGFSESGRDYNTVDVGTSTLNNIIFPPFKASVDAGVKTFMNSFNELNGIPATGNAFLQREVLKDKWNFDGFVVSDWGSIKEMIAHGYAKDLNAAAELAANAGSDMDMESYAYVEELSKLVKENKVSVDFIDDAVKRILKVKYELGLFDDPYKYCNEEREKEVTGNKAINEAVLDVAKKSIVLLKNENNLLPLKKNGQKIALIGALAADKTSPLGSWRIAAEDSTAVSVLEGMKNYPNNTLTYAKGADVAIGKAEFAFELKINTTDKSEFSKAINTAKNADVVVMVLGEHGYQSGEARSRTSLDLPGVQQELLEAVYAVNKNIVLVLNNGRPLAITWADEHIPAIVEAWHLGTQTGNAVAQVLYGDYNPSGKLPMTFPRNVGQVPIYYNYKNTGRPSTDNPDIVFWSHYIDESNKPLYPFGHGLSYTKFTYKNLKVTKLTNEEVEVSVAVSNVGEYKGKEVVQLYIRDLFASVTRPVKELKGFKMVELEPNTTKTITLKLTNKELGFFNNQGEFIVEPGEFKVFVGGSSYTSLEEDFTL